MADDHDQWEDEDAWDAEEAHMADAPGASAMRHNDSFGGRCWRDSSVAGSDDGFGSDAESDMLMSGEEEGDEAAAASDAGPSAGLSAGLSAGAPLREAVAPTSCLHATDMRNRADAKKILDADGAHPPDFSRVEANSTGWHSLGALMAAGAVHEQRPAYTMVVNVPVNFWESNASEYTAARGPPDAEGDHCVAIAKLLGLLFVPLAKGYRSGAHVDDERRAAASEADEEQAGASEGRASRRDTPRADRYMYMHEHMSAPVPMRVYGHELLRSARGEVVAVRVWIFVYDSTHDVTKLAQDLMSESESVRNAGHLSQTSAAKRRTTYVTEHKSIHDRLGGEGSRPEHLPTNVHLRYAHVTNTEELHGAYCAYGASGEARAPVFHKGDVTAAAHAEKLQDVASEMGCHLLSPRYALNARRALPLRAGLLWDGAPIDVDPAQLRVETYFTDDGRFRAGAAVVREGMYLLTNSYCKSLFTAAMPVPVRGTMEIAPILLELFDVVERAGGARRARAPSAADARADTARERFIRMMSNRDEEASERARVDRASISGSDALAAGVAGAAAASGAAGAAGASAAARDALRVIAKETVSVHARVVQRYAACARECDARVAALRDESARVDAIRQRVAAATRALFELHVSRTMGLFESRSTRALLPGGYAAVVDHFRAQLEESPTRSAAMAFEGTHGFDVQTRDSTPWAQWRHWVRAEVYQKLLQGDGRSWPDLLENVHLHSYEPFSDGGRTLMLLSGAAGVGKTTVIDRLQHLMAPGSFVASGTQSKLAGKNGDRDPTNGTVKVWNEINKQWVEHTTAGESGIDDFKRMCDASCDGPAGLTHQRTVRDEATQEWTTKRIETPHCETFICSSNVGPRVAPGEAMTENARALVTRSQTLQVRMQRGVRPNDHAAVKRKLDEPRHALMRRRYAVWDTLSKIVCMIIAKTPCFMPDFAHAYEVFEYLDTTMLEEEYNMPQKPPRRKAKRAVDLLALCVQHAVVHVYMFKSTAVEYDCAVPDEEGRAPAFEWAHLWEVVREAQAPPSMELILQAWAFSLDYDPNTSNHVLNAMAGVCEAFDLDAATFLSRPDDAELAAFAEHDVLDDRPQPCIDRQLTSIAGLRAEDLREWLRLFERQRRCTAAYRKQARAHPAGALDDVDDLFAMVNETMRTAPLPRDFEGLGDAAAEAVARNGTPFTDAAAEGYMPLYPSVLAPLISQVISMVSEAAVPRWMCAQAVDRQAHCSSGAASIGATPRASFRNCASRDDAQGAEAASDAAAWDTSTLSLALSNVRRGGAEGSNRWERAARLVADCAQSALVKDMLEANFLRDSMISASNEDPDAKRVVTKPARLRPESVWASPFVEPDGVTPATALSSEVGMRSRRAHGHGAPLYSHAEEASRAAQSARDGGLDAQLLRHPYAGVRDTPMQRAVDLAVRNGRLPTAAAVLSSNVGVEAPLSISEHRGVHTLNMSHSCAVETAHMRAEATVRVALLPGGNPRSRAPAADGGEAHLLKLPECHNLQQMAFVAEAAGYACDTGAADEVRRLARRLARLGGADAAPSLDDALPGLQLRHSSLVADDATRQLISVPVPVEADGAQPQPNFARRPPPRAPTPADARQASVREGRHVSVEELVARRAEGEDDGRHGVGGNVFDQQTVSVFALASMLDRGFLEGPDDPSVPRLRDRGRALRPLVLVRECARQINAVVKAHLARTGEADTPAARARLYRDRELLGERLWPYWRCGFVGAPSPLYRARADDADEAADVLEEVQEDETMPHAGAAALFATCADSDSSDASNGPVVARKRARAA